MKCVVVSAPTARQSLIQAIVYLLEMCRSVALLQHTDQIAVPAWRDLGRQTHEIKQFNDAAPALERCAWMSIRRPNWP
jgi:hypothetical protein